MPSPLVPSPAPGAPHAPGNSALAKSPKKPNNLILKSTALPAVGKPAVVVETEVEKKDPAKSLRRSGSACLHNAAKLAKFAKSKGNNGSVDSNSGSGSGNGGNNGKNKAANHRPARAWSKTPVISIDMCSDDDLNPSYRTVYLRQAGNSGPNAEGQLSDGEPELVESPSYAQPPGLSTENSGANGGCGKRHSTGDASETAGFSSSQLLQQSMGVNMPRNSTVSLYDPAHAGNHVNHTKPMSRSRTAITDF